MAPSLNPLRPTHSSRPSLSSQQGGSHPFSPSAQTTTSSQGGYSYSQYGGYSSTSPGLPPNQAPPSQNPPRSGSSNNLASSASSGQSQQYHNRQPSGSRPPQGILLNGRSASGGSGVQQQAQQATQEKLDQARDVAKVHYQALRAFLWTWLENESPTSRASAREKLTRLTRSQFQELSTDVYDELVRRRDAEEGNSAEAPFLPVREDFHPKRNQARQKLATLPKNRFKDLGSDVYFELKRRWPEFAESVQSPTVDSPTSAYPPTAGANIHDNLARRSDEPPMPTRDRALSPANNQQARNSGNNQTSPAKNKNPTPDRLVPGPARRPSQMDRAPGLPSSQSQSGLQSLSGSSMNDTVVPNKSTMTEERIEVPYAREGRDSLVSGDESGMDTEEEEKGKERELEQEREREREREKEQEKARGHQRQSSRASSTMSRSQTMSRTSSRLGTAANGRYQQAEAREDLEEEDDPSPRNRNITPNNLSNGDRTSSYSNSSQLQRTRSEMQRGLSHENRSPSITSLSTATATGASGGITATAMADLMKERKARSEAETKSAGLERRLSALEKEVKAATEREKWERDRAKELEEEVRSHKERSSNHANELWSMQRELDAVRSQAETHKREVETARQGDDAQLKHLKERCTQLEREAEHAREQLSRANRTLDENDSAEAIKELQNELIILMEELKAVSTRNEELLVERDEDAETIRKLEADAADYKRKWETTRTQLRNLKATSTMFVSKPITDDHMPASLDGNIADVHVTAFQSAIDNLLAIARSSQPTGVLQAMKGVVESINDISEDVHDWESEPNFTIDQTQLDVCKHQSSTTLNALMQAARNHAMSAGLSPISLLDAAASHVSANVVEIIKLLKIRKTIKTSASTTSLSRKSFSEMQTRRSFSSGSVIAGKGDHSREQRQSPPPSPGESLLSPLQPSFSQGPPLSPGFRGGRADSVISTSSAGQRSDAFDLDRKASVLGNRQHQQFASDLAPNMPMQRQTPDRYSPQPPSASIAPRSWPSPEPPYQHRSEERRISSPLRSPGRSSPGRQSPTHVTDLPESTTEQRPRRNSGEWEEVKPYLSTQSSALVNSIQQLLAEIRNGNNANGTSSTSALNDHLSEVIAIGSSIVAVASGVLPNEDDGPEGVEAQRLLAELMHSTDKLSTHQSATEFTKAARQEIASAAFGMAKALRGLMKVQ